MKLPLLFILLFATNLFCYAQTPSPDSSETRNNNTEAVKGLAILPSKISFNLNSGETGTKKVKISNNTADTVQFKVYLADWLRDSTGGHNYFRPGTLSRSCARWITLDKSFVELKPGETQEVAVKMQIPDSADAVKEMKWSMLFVETKPEKILSSKHLELGKNARIGIHIYQTPPSLSNAEAKILNFCAEKGSDTSYCIVCQNTGNIQYEPKCYMELTPIGGEGDKITVPAKPFPVFPDQVRYVRLVIPKTVPKGKYNAIAVVEAGGDAPLEAAQAVIEVK